MAAYAYTVTNGGPGAALEIAGLLLAASIRELAGLAAAGLNSAAYDERTGYLLGLYSRRNTTLADLGAGKTERGEIMEAVKDLDRRLAGFVEANRPSGARFSRKAQTGLEREADSLVPVRLVRGPLSLTRVPERVKEERGLECSCWSHEQNAPSYWSDGRRSIFEIQWLVGQELGTQPELEKLMSLFRTMEEYGYVTLKKRG
jgi:hypothetical protein